MHLLVILLRYYKMLGPTIKTWWKVFTARYGLIPYIKQNTFRL
jgi:hypothetical protein